MQNPQKCANFDKKIILYNRKKAFWGVFLPRTTPVSVLDVDKNMLPPPFPPPQPKRGVDTKRKEKEGRRRDKLISREGKKLFVAVSFAERAGKGEKKRRGQFN